MRLFTYYKTEKIAKVRALINDKLVRHQPITIQQFFLSHLEAKLT